METLRVGVIGVGSMGKHHARVYSGMRGTELVGIADPSASNLDELAETYHTNAYKNYSDLLALDIDAVSIAVPTTLHQKIACEVLSMGVNVLLEKPIADTLENAEKIINEAKKNNVKLMIGHVERFNPIIPVIKNSISREEIILIDITRVGPLPPRVKDVGVMIDLGVHDIDLIRYLTGSEYDKIFPLISSNITHKEDTAIVSFRMKNSTLAHLTTDWLTPFKVREIEISTKEKFIKGDFITQKVTEYYKYEKDGSYLVRNLAVPPGESLLLELSSYLKCIRSGQEPEVSGLDGLEALKIALKCLEISSKE
ncbi:MAG: Gfo/Idh/MocA family oxidoreductase [Candidatus Altiarchaeia archaeon]